MAIVTLKSNSPLPKKFALLALMKNAFYFILKALFVLKIFFFFLTFWSCRKNGSIRKIVLVS